MSRDADACPHCGYTPSDWEQHPFIQTFAWLLTIGVLVWGAQWCATLPVDSGSSGGSGGSTEAWVVCQQLVEDRLKSPSTADFEFGGARKVVRQDDGTYSVSSFVDAENPMGGTVRINFNCAVEKKGDTWRRVSLDVRQR